ncbi:hypothetical protein OK006_7926 [Actinobacteria bacterium OK006]|nr:hypothetical protein OK006_7926 [Actinobacteria bacterium OK006]
MTYHVTLGTAGTSTVVRLVGDGDGHDVEALRGVLDEAVRQVSRRLVIDLHDAHSLPAAAVRCLAFAGQRVPPAAEVVVEGASPVLLSRLRLAGLDRSMTIVARETAELTLA